MSLNDDLLAIRTDLATALDRVDRLIGQHPAADAEDGADMHNLDRTVAIETVLRRRGAPMRPVEIWADLRAAGRPNDPKMEVQVTTYDLWKRGRIDKVARGQYVTKGGARKSTREDRPEGKYASLREHLLLRQASPWKANFSEVEALVPGGLPRSAYEHAAWWSNSDSHPEAVAWLDAGWRTESVNLLSRTVTFVRST